MSSKAAKRNRKRNRSISLPGGEVVADRATGRDRTHTNQPQECPTVTVLQARARHTGVKGRENLIDTALGTPIGCCIAHLTRGDDRATLIDTWGAISASRRNYKLRYIGHSGEPQGAALEMIPDAMQTDPSMRVDIRSTEERAAQAKASWQSWETKINALPLPTMKWAIRGALDGFAGEGTLWRDQGATPLGRVAVEALRRLS